MLGSGPAVPWWFDGCGYDDDDDDDNDAGGGGGAGGGSFWSLGLPESV